jgi:hypothetical protein
MCGAGLVLWHGTKWAIFVSRSTTTRMASKPVDKGRSVIKSQEIEAHGLEGIGSGCNSPYGACRGALERWHVSQLST